MDKRTDGELVEAARSVDREAFDELVCRYQPIAQCAAEKAKTIGFAPTVPEGLGPGRLADAVAAGIALPLEARQQLLETLDPSERLEKLNSFLG